MWEARLKDLMEGVDDPEQTHIEADAILLEFLHSQGYRNITKAYQELQEKVGFWYA
jgi:hypothetical protein